jgi:hypothetical protein
MKEIARFTINLKRCRDSQTPAGTGPLGLLLDGMRRIKDSDDAELAMILEKSNECTVVYFGCGSCANGGARVEYYCSSSGGSDPDYVTCEPC